MTSPRRIRPTRQEQDEKIRQWAMPHGMSELLTPRERIERFARSYWRVVTFIAGMIAMIIGVCGDLIFAHRLFEQGHAFWAAVILVPGMPLCIAAAAAAVAEVAAVVCGLGILYFRASAPAKEPF